MSKERLMSWFAKRRETIAIKMARDHLAKVVDSIVELNKGVLAARNKNVAEVKRCRDRLFSAEDEADRIRRAIDEELTKGELPPKDREDLMHLVKRIDAVADWARDAFRNLTILMDANIPNDVWDGIAKVSGSLVECAWALRKSIEALDKNVEGALKLSIEVDRIEHRVDEEYFAVKGAFLKYAGEITPPTFIILRDLLHDMELVADSCEDAADLMRIIAIRI